MGELNEIRGGIRRTRRQNTMGLVWHPPGKGKDQLGTLLERL